MFDIITFGSATQDVFMGSRKFKVVDNNKFITGRGLCVPLGSKIHIEDVFFATGGCGANTSVTFARQGLKTAYCGQVGSDYGGAGIKKELKKNKVSLKLLKETNKWATAFSVILSLPETGRSILEYLGACHYLTKEDIPFNKLKAKWFYIGPLSGKSSCVLKPLVNFASRKKIKIAFNPGKTQLTKDLKILRSLLAKVDILILNQEEAALLTDLDFQEEDKIFQRLDKWVRGIVVMTKGPKGVKVSDGRNLYLAGIPKSGLADRTGAGDAFASGFVSGIIQKLGHRIFFKKDKLSLTPEIIKYAIQLGTANATSCLQEFGAVNGLLKKGEWGLWPRVRVKIIENSTK